MEIKKQVNKKKVVLVFGTFDLLHLGHVDLFKQARKYGDYLVAVVARDKTVLQVKKIKPIHSEKIRLKTVSKQVDKAVLGNIDDKYAVILKINPDVICLGYDQTSFTGNLRKILSERGISPLIVRLKPHKEEIYKSSIMRKKIK
ncbi:MAG: adenylyltransferase/cytidyltransferase family protein [Nanoarchaeota archaeon]|nr:adenylyltransferase/cytidyltransferase family protein [Nanoarchaeota archaeon]